jgi:DNA polymerase/3'-5' exonuclease PolX
MSTTENKIPLAVAKNVAERFIKYLTPYCSQISVAGSVRREVEYCGDVEVCAIPKDEFSMSVAFPLGFKGLTINGERLKRFIYPESGIQIELYLPQYCDYGRILAIRTGSSAYAHHLMIEANRHGWIGTVDGLRRKKECEKKGSVWKIKPEYKINPTLPPVFNTEEKFFEFIGAKWISPQERSWVDSKGEYNYKL